MRPSQSEPDAESGDATYSVKQSLPVRRGLVFFIVACALMMMAIDGTIIATALDALTAGLNTSVGWAGWTITVYSFGFILMLPVSGKLTEYFGNRKVFMGSVIVFTVASLFCGLAHDIQTLIILRALQAAGGAGFMPAATGIIVQHFGDTRDRTVGLFGSIFPIGAMIGPIFGGLFVAYWSWRGIFLINVPIGLLVAILVYKYVPHDRPRSIKGNTMLDMKGLAFLGCGLLCVMFAVTHLSEPGIHPLSLSFLLPLVIGTTLVWLLFRHIRRVKSPVVNPRLIYRRNFGVINLVNLVYGGSSTGLLVLVPLYAINRYDLSAVDAGTLLIAQGGAAIVFSSLTVLGLRSTGYRLPMYFGALFIIISFGLLAIDPWGGMSPYAWLALVTFMFGVGSGILNPSSRNAGLQLAPQQAASIAALRSMCMETGRIATVSIATAIIASVEDPSYAQSWIYAVAAVLLIFCLPLISGVPEHYGSW